ncbi:MAG: sugar ABC transporter permease, partial [Chloroflexota bacterium]|nr:sugar ABC transporter permease [Chloroflexota bacterium]
MNLTAEGAARGAGTGIRKRGRIRRDHLMFLAFIAPNFFLLGLFTYWPMIYQAYLSLTRWDLISPVKVFVGMDNYATLFGGREFRRVLLNTFYFTGAALLGSIVLGLALAMLLNQRLRAKHMTRNKSLKSSGLLQRARSQIGEEAPGIAHQFIDVARQAV